jgi:tetratricopeptide (TPR) repeat protein
MNVKVYSREAIERLINDGYFPFNTAVISFFNTNKKRHDIKYNPVDYSSVCKNVFYCEIDEPNFELLEEKDYDYKSIIPFADDMAAFIYNAFCSDMDIICQSENGQHKSAGCAAAILEHFYHKGVIIFSEYHYSPNQVVYHSILSALINYYKRSMDKTNLLSREIYDNARYLALTCNDIANQYRDNGDYDNSIEYYKKALAMRESILGHNHIDTYRTYISMALCYERKSDYSNVVKYYKKALKAMKDILEANHSEIATIYNNIGYWYKIIQDYDKAIDNYKQSIKHENTAKTDSKSIAIKMEQLAELYQIKSEDKKASKCLEKAHILEKEKFKTDKQLYIAKSHNYFACMAIEDGNCESALNELFKELKILESILGVQHPDTLSCYNTIAHTYGMKGNMRKKHEFMIKAGKCEIENK